MNQQPAPCFAWLSTLSGNQRQICPHWMPPKEMKKCVRRDAELQPSKRFWSDMDRMIAGARKPGSRNFKTTLKQSRQKLTAASKCRPSRQSFWQKRRWVWSHKNRRRLNVWVCFRFQPKRFLLLTVVCWWLFEIETTHSATFFSGRHLSRYDELVSTTTQR